MSACLASRPTCEFAAVGGLELLGRVEAGLDLHGQVDLVRGGQQVDLADLLEVHAHRVAGEHDSRGIDAAHAGTRARRAGARLLLARGTHLGLGDLGDLDVVVLDALVIQVAIEVVDAQVVVGAGVRAERQVVVGLPLGDYLDAAVTERTVDRGKLCIVDIDVLQDDLDLVLGNRPGYRAPVYERVDIRIEPGILLLGLLRHKSSLPQSTGLITLTQLSIPSTWEYVARKIIRPAFDKYPWRQRAIRHRRRDRRCR